MAPPPVPANPDANANTWAGFAESFAIFAQYGEGYYATEGDRDKIRVSLDRGQRGQVSLEHRERLEALGWRYTEEEDGFCIFT